MTGKRSVLPAAPTERSGIDYSKRDKGGYRDIQQQTQVRASTFYVGTEITRMGQGW